MVLYLAIGGLLCLGIFGMFDHKDYEDYEEEQNKKTPKEPKKPKTCSGCGNHTKHCICNELDKGAKEVNNLLSKYRHK